MSEGPSSPILKLELPAISEILVFSEDFMNSKRCLTKNLSFSRRPFDRTSSGASQEEATASVCVFVCVPYD